MINIIPVNKTDIDAKIIMNWRNNKDSRNNSINTNFKVWDTFKYEFYNNYFDNIPLFATIDNQKIAFVSFIKHKDDTYKIGINIAPIERGKGYSKKIIKSSLKYIKSNYPYIKIIIAEIKKFNLPSIKTFTGSGFICIKKDTINEYVYNIA